MAFNVAPKMRRGLVVGAAALALGGAAFGVAGAQQVPTPTPGAAAQAGPRGDHQQRMQQFLDTVAAKLGVTPDRLRQAMAEARAELGLPDRRPGPFGGPGGMLRHGLDVAAQAIGITPAQLRQELPGKSLADVARAHNVDPARVAGTLKADANARIDQAVSAGRLTADQAAQLKQRAATQIDQLMTRQVPARPAAR